MIFLSHSGVDRPFLRPLVAALREASVNIWFCEDDIPAAQTIPGAMNDALERADRLLVAWSKDARQSRHVWNELEAFYMLHPESGRILFVQLDGTRVPALYAARRYFRFDVATFMQSVANWNGIFAEATLAPDTSALDLSQFPRGPRVDGHWITQPLIQTFADLYDTPALAYGLIAKANLLREQLDGGDPTVRYIKRTFLPDIGKSSYEFWAATFEHVRRQGPRMLAALLLAEADDQFDDAARRDRTMLLNKIRQM